MQPNSKETHDLSGTPPPYAVHVEQEVAALRDQVWKLWASEKYWTMGFQGRRVRMLDPFFDIRPGGSFRHGLVSMGIETWFHGVYTAIEPLERMEFKHVWENEGQEDEPETHVTVKFTDLGGKTHIDLKQANIKNLSAHGLYNEFWIATLKHFARTIEDSQKLQAYL